MATTDLMKSYESAPDIVKYWMNNIAPRYFDTDKINTYRAGTFGYINDAMATSVEDAFHAMLVSKREVLPNTAQYMKSLYTHAASRYMDAPMATPAQATILLMIQQSDVHKYGETEGDMHTFVLDKTFIAWCDEIPFMLDYPLHIISVRRENGKFAYTTHYDVATRNDLVNNEERYVPNKIIHYRGTDYLAMSIRMRQVERTYQSQLVTSNTIISTVTMDFNYTGDLANFEVFYQEDDSKPKIQLRKIMQDANIPHEPFCWYNLIDNETIRLIFPANIYFTPRLNSTVDVEIFTTLGANGNFKSYDIDIISENDSRKYPYNAQVPIFGVVDGSSRGGKDAISKEDFRNEVMRRYATNNTFTTCNDLQLYFDSMMIGTTDRFKFTPKRDDAFVRIYGAFLRMKDEANNVVPTNTLNIILDPYPENNDFDIYSEAVHRHIIRPGALFSYYHDEDHKYILRRCKEHSMYDDLTEYKNGKHWSCDKCGHCYTGETPFEELPDDYACEKCGTEKKHFHQDRFIFTNPYLISVSSDTFVAGYFLNSLDKNFTLRYTDVNDHSIVQFIAKSFYVERNAISGENFYRFSVTLSPSVEIDMDKIVHTNTGMVVAAHNGYVKSITYIEDAVYAIIQYTDDPTLATGEELSTDSESIQVSSIVEKLDNTFMVCPHCHHRYTMDEWKALEEAGTMVDQFGNSAVCPNCPDDLEYPMRFSDYEEKYIDYDYRPGYTMNFGVGDKVTKNDVIATQRVTDTGRVRLVMDFGDVMTSDAHRYIPMTIEAINTEAQAYTFAAYISTTDMIDSKMLMSIENGYVMTDGSSGEGHSLSLPITGLNMRLHAFYQYQEDDNLEIDVRNPAHKFSSYHYMSLHTFTNTYELREGERITLIQALDNAKGFLDVFEKEEIIIPPDPEPEPEPKPHPDDEYGDDADDPRYCYLRGIGHEKFKVDELENDRYDYHFLAVLQEDQSPTDEEVNQILRDKVFLLNNKSGYMNCIDTTNDRFSFDHIVVNAMPIKIPTKPYPLPTDPPPENPNPPTEEDDGVVVVPTNPVPNIPQSKVPFGGNFMYMLRNCPVVSAEWIKQRKNEKYFIDRIHERYDAIEKVQIRLENAFSLDMKFYNTYGKSMFYKIGNRDNLEVLDSVNITIDFGSGIIFPASAEVFRNNFKSFVRDYVEANDDSVGNGIDMYLLNLVSAAKVRFDEIGYLEYYGLNDYDFSAQRITSMSDAEILETVSPDEFVPEFLNIVREEVNGVLVPKVSVTVEVLDTGVKG